MHVCPEATKEANATPLTADIRSASSNTRIGAWERGSTFKYGTLDDPRLTHLSTKLSRKSSQVGTYNTSEGAPRLGASLRTLLFQFDTFGSMRGSRLYRPF